MCLGAFGCAWVCARVPSTHVRIYVKQLTPVDFNFLIKCLKSWSRQSTIMHEKALTIRIKYDGGIINSANGPTCGVCT